jgi:hypothetical protein
MRRQTRKSPKKVTSSHCGRLGVESVTIFTLWTGKVDPSGSKRPHGVDVADHQKGTSTQMSFSI